MSFFEFPNTRTYDSDLGWLIKAMEELIVKVDTFIDVNKIKFADPITWDITKQYAANTIVISADGEGYISRKNVPAGVTLDQTGYWTKLFDFSELLKVLRHQIAANDDGSSTTATFASTTGELVWLNNILYRVVQNISIGTAYVDGENIEHVTVEGLITDVRNIAEFKNNNFSDRNHLIYVNNSIGSDENDGLSRERPVSTLDKALSEMLKGYSTLSVLVTGGSNYHISLHNTIANCDLHLYNISGANVNIFVPDSFVIYNSRINITGNHDGTVGSFIIDTENNIPWHVDFSQLYLNSVTIPSTITCITSPIVSNDCKFYQLLFHGSNAWLKDTTMINGHDGQLSDRCIQMWAGSISIGGYFKLDGNRNTSGYAVVYINGAILGIETIPTATSPLTAKYDQFCRAVYSNVNGLNYEIPDISTKPLSNVNSSCSHDIVVNEITVSMTIAGNTTGEQIFNAEKNGYKVVGVAGVWTSSSGRDSILIAGFSRHDDNRFKLYVRNNNSSDNTQEIKCSIIYKRL